MSATWDETVREAERLGWWHVDGEDVVAGPRPVIVETEGPIRARLTTGEIVELPKDCECIVHEGPHWLYVDWCDKQANSDILLRRDWLAPLAFAKEDGARLARKLYEMNARHIAEIIWPSPVNPPTTPPLCDRIAAEPSGGAVQAGGARGASESSTVQE